MRIALAAVHTAVAVRRVAARIALAADHRVVVVHTVVAHMAAVVHTVVGSAVAGLDRCTLG